MRNLILLDEFHQTDFKPSDVLHRYMELTREDIATFFTEPNNLEECFCPACINSEIASKFSKFGMQYLECACCGTLRVSPRPNDKDILRFYKQSSAERYWQDELVKATKAKRKAKIIEPRLQWIQEAIQEYLPDAEHYIDIHTHHIGYVEEISKASGFRKRTLIDPLIPQELSSSFSNVEIVSDSLPIDNFKENVDAISIFEIADHTSEVGTLFGQIHEMLRKGGLCFMTCILASGFDLQILWEHSENLFPPDRLNVFSVEGLRVLFEKHGFEVLEFSTPGILDLEIVNRAVSKNPDILLPRFVSYVLNNRDETVKNSFQEFLQAGLLSSYGRILLRKN